MFLYILILSLLGSSEKETVRRAIQNSMDAARYLSPFMTNLVQFIIPLHAPSPRPLYCARQATDNNRSNS
jgi:hypothetical protein